MISFSGRSLHAKERCKILTLVDFRQIASTILRHVGRIVATLANVSHVAAPGGRLLNIGAIAPGFLCQDDGVVATSLIDGGRLTIPALIDHGSILVTALVGINILP